MAFATTRIIDRGRNGQIIYEACLCEQHLQTDAPHDLRELEVTPIDPAAKVPCAFAHLAPEFRYAGYVDCAKIAALLLFALLTPLAACSSPTAPSAPSPYVYLSWNAVGTSCAPALGAPMVVGAPTLRCALAAGNTTSCVKDEHTAAAVLVEWPVFTGGTVSALFTPTADPETFGLCVWGIGK